jgi:hypothetical protein
MVIPHLHSGSALPLDEGFSEKVADIDVRA